MMTATLLKTSLCFIIFAHCDAFPLGGLGGLFPSASKAASGLLNNAIGWASRQRLTDDVVKILQANCLKKGTCLNQTLKALSLRAAVKQSLLNPNGGLDDAKVENQLQKTLEAKKALFSVNGLRNIIPLDTGLFGGDMVLSVAQLNRIINRSKGIEDQNAIGKVPLVDAASVESINSTSTRRKRGDIEALDYYTGNKWPSTYINFYISPSSYSSWEASQIRSALQSIASSTCLRFVEQWKYPVIQYLRTPRGTDSGTCGWASVGYQGNYNSVNINFDSSTCRSTIQGSIIHETLHVLGFVHEHNRYDRDRYLRVNWRNVDSQAYDTYDKDDPREYNPYCVPFDLLSIMHYDAYVAAIDYRYPAMTPVYYPDYYLPKMGMGTRMSSYDTYLVNKMYCRSSSCKDQSVNCGWTGCMDCNKYGAACPKSCNKC